MINLMKVKNVVFWDAAPCRSSVNRRFGGTYRLDLQGRKNPLTRNQREQVAAATTQKTTFFIMTVVKTSDLT
jgi:hypothetical protein